MFSLIRANPIFLPLNQVYAKEEDFPGRFEYLTVMDFEDQVHINTHDGREERVFERVVGGWGSTLRQRLSGSVMGTSRRLDDAPDSRV